MMRWSSISLCLAAYICCAASITFGDVSKQLRYDSLPNPKYTPGISRASIPALFLYIPSGKLCTPEDPYFEGYRYPCKIAYCTRHVTESLKRTVASYYGPCSIHLAACFDQPSPDALVSCSSTTHSLFSRRCPRRRLVFI